MTSSTKATAWIDKLPFEILEKIAQELLISDDKIIRLYLPSPITPLLHLAIFRPVARPILYRSVSLGNKVTFPSGNVRKGCISAQLALKTFERNFKITDTEPDAAELVRNLELVSWNTTGRHDAIVDDTTKEMVCHEHIIRICSAVSDVTLWYRLVPHARQPALRDVLAGQTSLRSLVVYVHHISPWEDLSGLYTFSELLEMICKNWPKMRTLELGGHAIERRNDYKTFDASIIPHDHPIALESLILGDSDDRNMDYALDDRDLFALLAVPLHRLTTVKLSVLTNARTLAHLQLCLDAWAPTLECLRISSGKFLSPNDCIDDHVNNECPFVVEGPRINHLTRLQELELVRIFVPAESLRRLTQLKKLTLTIDEKRYVGFRDLLEQDWLPSLEFLKVWNFLMRSADVGEVLQICREKKLRSTVEAMCYSW